jgi:hypothetical protein
MHPWSQAAPTLEFRTTRRPECTAEKLNFRIASISVDSTHRKRFPTAVQAKSEPVTRAPSKCRHAIRIQTGNFRIGRCMDRPAKPAGKCPKDSQDLVVTDGTGCHFQIAASPARLVDAVLRQLQAGTVTASKPRELIFQPAAEYRFSWWMEGGDSHPTKPDSLAILRLGPRVLSTEARIVAESSRTKNYLEPTAFATAEPRTKGLR